MQNKQMFYLSNMTGFVKIWHVGTNYTPSYNWSYISNNLHFYMYNMHPIESYAFKLYLFCFPLQFPMLIVKVIYSFLYTNNQCLAMNMTADEIIQEKN